MVKKRAMSAAAKGAIVIGMRYGPHIYELVKHGKEPAQEAIATRLAKRSARKQALEHARTLKDGTILKVVHDGAAHFVVFSGDECIATYPPTDVGYAELLRHSDLALRERPEAQLRRTGRGRQRRDPGATA